MKSPAPQISIFDSPYKALVIGATGTIGKAFVDAFSHDPYCEHVQSVARALNPGFDLLDETSLQHCADICRPQGPFHIIIDATGALSMKGIGPEKSMASLKQDTLLKNFQVNAIGPVLALRYFAPLLMQGPSIYAKLSARVGSISDNRKGGWYGYRAAKAALNMFLQTASIEIQRKNPQTQIVALQPGTVKSPLSQAFASSVPHLLEPHEAVVGMLSALKHLEPRRGAHFLDYKGESIDW